MNIQILEHESQEWYHVYNETYQKIIVNDWQKISPDELVVCSGNLLKDYVRYYLTNNQPAVYVARGYLGNHLYKHRKWFRFSVNAWANTRILPIPYSRWSMLNLEYHPWKVKEVKRVLIAPSKMTAKYWSPEVSHNWAESMLDKFPGAEVRIRPKPGKKGLRYESLWNDLDWADLIVSQSSAITVEAFWYGKKVISLAPCPTWAAEKTTLENWQDPTEPKLRELWHEHVAWCQFSAEEIQNGIVIDLLKRYFGDLLKHKIDHQYLLTRC